MILYVLYYYSLQLNVTFNVVRFLQTLLGDSDFMTLLHNCSYVKLKTKYNMIIESETTKRTTGWWQICCLEEKKSILKHFFKSNFFGSLDKSKQGKCASMKIENPLFLFTMGCPLKMRHCPTTQKNIVCE